MKILSALRSALASFWASITPLDENKQMIAFLEQSVDVYDLEARQRAWDQRKLSGSSYPW